MLEQAKGSVERIVSCSSRCCGSRADERSRIKLVEVFAALGRSRDEVRALEQA